MENRFGWSDRREVNGKNEIDPSQYGVIILPPRDRYSQRSIAATKANITTKNTRDETKLICFVKSQKPSHSRGSGSPYQPEITGFLLSQE